MLLLQKYIYLILTNPLYHQQDLQHSEVLLLMLYIAYFLHLVLPEKKDICYINPFLCHSSHPLQTRIDLFSFLLSKILLMSSFDIILINHSILHSGINLGMSKYLLNLFNRHSLINSSRSH